MGDLPLSSVAQRRLLFFHSLVRVSMGFVLVRRLLILYFVVNVFAGCYSIDKRIIWVDLMQRRLILGVGWGM